MLFLCHSTCRTCRKAQAWLDAHNVDYEARSIKSDSPRVDELIDWHRKSTLSIKRFFNTSGQVYKSLGLTGKLSGMSDAQLIALLATNGMLLRCPILVDDDFVLVGFKEEEWAEKLEQQHNT